jgi:short-subunit dehydrogenase
LKALADELARGCGVRTEVIAADLADADSRGELPGQLEGRGLIIDILVNNAGFTTMGPVYRADRAQELAMVRTDVEAVVDLCTLFVPGMVTRRRGAVLNTASTAAFQPLPGQAGYGAAKAFVLSYGRALGAELRGTGVTVTTLCPGPVETGFADVAGLTDDEAAETLPKLMWVPAADVARAAIEGLTAGRAVVIPGAANRATAVLAHLAPKALILPMMAQRHPAMRPSPSAPPSQGSPEP